MEKFDFKNPESKELNEKKLTEFIEEDIVTSIETSESVDDAIEISNLRKKLGIESAEIDFSKVFSETKDALEKRLSGTQVALEQSLQRLQKEKQNLGENQESSPKIKAIKETVAQRQEAINRLNKIKEFLREPTEADVLYRKEIESTWSNEVFDITPKDIPLRFHGCPIYTARDILNSGGISSSVDRLGYETSWDAEDQVSVTTPYTLATTVNGYSDLHAENYCLPAGCIFAMLPKDALDAESGDSFIMSNVDFKTEPERLFSIITTPENLKVVKEWASKNNIDINKITDFKSFLDQFKQN